MSTPTTHLRQTNASTQLAKAIRAAMTEGVDPSSLAISIAVEMGLDSDTEAKQLRIRRASRLMERISDELDTLNSLLDDARHDEQDARWPELRAKIIGGEGGATPAGKTEGAALPRSLDEVMGHPLTAIDQIIGGLAFRNGACVGAVPDNACIIDTIQNEIETEEVANGLPLGYVGPDMLLGGQFGNYIST